MSESPLVPIDEVMAHTGLTKLQVRWDVKHRYLPGMITHRNKVVIRRNGPDSWNEYLDGTWIPAEPGSHREAKAPKPAKKPVGIVSLHEKAS